MRKTLAALTAFALAAPLAVAPAFAAPAKAPVQVRFDDLELETPAGKSTLDARIRTAARSFCRHTESTGTLMDQSVCLRQIRAEVLARIDELDRTAKGG